jgi:hypothetical protein|tara:strand:+ start:4215 stop:4373 length:159 start_codon:yes stop_codon:yes gene_type:complete
MPQYKTKQLNAEETARLDDELTKVFGASAARRITDENFRYGFFIGMNMKEEN